MLKPAWTLGDLTESRDREKQREVHVAAESSADQARPVAISGKWKREE
jgi:hypothetical protein